MQYYLVAGWQLIQEKRYRGRKQELQLHYSNLNTWEDCIARIMHLFSPSNLLQVFFDENKLLEINHLKITQTYSKTRTYKS